MAEESETQVPPSGTTTATTDGLAELPPTGRRDGMGPARASLLVVVVGVLITASVTWTAWALDRHNEQQLLDVQTRQAAAVLSSTVLGIQDPLTTALDVESATGGSTAEFARFASTYVGPQHLFVSAVLWTSDGTGLRPVDAVGSPSFLDPDSAAASTLVARAVAGPTFIVESLRSGDAQRIGYAIGDRADPSVAIYAERAIPADREVPVESDPAFADLDFATYVGPTTDATALATTDVSPSQLPLTGQVSRASIPLGNTTLTLVASPRVPLGGTLGRDLPWVFLVGGTAITAGTAVVAYLLTSRRRRAERDARTIAGLYDTLDQLYGEQRSIASTLQQALLPQRNPTFASLQVASRYVAGGDGVDIGGDWYSLIEVDDHRFAFAVGDVSGKGISAASMMARLRYTVRAYLLEGHTPDAVLEMCARQVNVNRDGHLSTVLVGMGDLDTGRVELANAGHLDPLVVGGDRAAFVPTTVGLPLGVTDSTYAATTYQLEPGDTFVAFTDGLIERRGENIDVGLARLVAAAAGDRPPEELLARLEGSMHDAGTDDDMTLLAFRWTGPRAGADTPGRPGSAERPIRPPAPAPVVALATDGPVQSGTRASPSAEPEGRKDGP